MVSVHRWFNLRDRQQKHASLPVPADFPEQWVAVRRGRVLAHSDLVTTMIDWAHGHRVGSDVTIWFEQDPDKVQRWGVMSANGRIGPNCFFDTEDEARRWQRSWSYVSDDPGVVVTRTGQHDPWEPVGGSDGL